MSQTTKFTYNEAKSKCKNSGGKLAEPGEKDNEEDLFSSLVIFCQLLELCKKVANPN